MTVFVNRLDTNNPGDFWSSPLHYFDFKNGIHLDIKDINEFDLNDDVIIGGGGLLGRISWDGKLKSLTENNNCILWGAGQNLYGKKKKGDMIGVKVDSKLPDYVSNFSKVGLRDYNLGYDWVPCASCMHKAFDKGLKITPNKDTLGIEHNKIKLRSNLYPTISHEIKPNDLEEFILKISEYRNIITNTYHGAYWAHLLGKRVIIQPWSSKFNNIKWNTGFIERDEHNLESIFDLFESLECNNQEALTESREANQKFYNSLEF